MITKLKINQIFVFGSNEAGRHGKGAAKTALKWGAEYGVGEGLRGQTYAIPTKDKNIRTLQIEKIKPYVDCFLQFADESRELEFLLTPIGCGLAGYSPKDIAPLFENAPPNVVLPDEFKNIN